MRKSLKILENYLTSKEFSKILKMKDLFEKSWKIFLKIFHIDHWQRTLKSFKDLQKNPYTYFCWRTIIFDMCTLTRMLIFSLWFFKVFGSYNFILFTNLLLYIWTLIYLFVLGRDKFFTFYICFKQTFFFNFSYILFNKYFTLPQSNCQFRV